MRTQRSQGNGGALRHEPLLVVVAGKVPTREVAAGIEHLAVVFIVRADRAVSGDFPLLVGGNALRAAVRKGNQDVDATLGKSEDGRFVRLVLSHGKQATVAQDDADGILLLQCRRDVVSVVEHRLAIVGRHGL